MADYITIQSVAKQITNCYDKNIVIVINLILIVVTNINRNKCSIRAQRKSSAIMKAPLFEERCDALRSRPTRTQKNRPSYGGWPYRSCEHQVRPVRPWYNHLWYSNSTNPQHQIAGYQTNSKQFSILQIN